jgi:hypothetical protein
MLSPWSTTDDVLTGDHVVNPKSLRFCAWCGPLVLIIFGSAFLLGGWVPIHSSTDSAEQVAAFYQHRTVFKQIGTLLMTVSSTLFVLWGAAIASQIRRCERGIPVFTYAMVALAGGGSAIGYVIFLSWGVAAFRPWTLSPQILLMLDDLGWFFMLSSIPMYMMWAVVIAAAIWFDQSEHPIFPRWVMYMNIATVILYIPTAFSAFDKSGPFANDGALGGYLQFGVYFVWEIAMSYALFRAANRVHVSPRPTPARSPATV